MKKTNDLQLANKLLLVQGISLIQDGLSLIEWMEAEVDASTFEALKTLRNSFENFSKRALANQQSDHFFIDRMTAAKENVIHEPKAMDTIAGLLEEVRTQVVEVQRVAKG